MAPIFEDGYEPLPPPPNTPILEADTLDVESNDSEYDIIGAVNLNDNTFSSGIRASRSVSERWSLDVANNVPEIIEAEIEMLDMIVNIRVIERAAIAKIAEFHALLNFIFINGLLYQVTRLHEQLDGALPLQAVSAVIILILLGFNIRGVAKRSKNLTTLQIKHTLYLDALLFFITTSTLALSAIFLGIKNGALGDGSISTGSIIHLVDHAMSSSGICPLDSCLPPYFPDSIVLLSRHLLIWYVSFWLAVGAFQLGLGTALARVMQVLIDSLNIMKACFPTVSELLYDDIDAALEMLFVSRILLPICVPLLVCIGISYSVLAAMGLGLIVSVLDAISDNISATNKCRKLYAGLWTDGIWAILGRILNYSRKVLMLKNEAGQSTGDTATRWVRFQLVAIIIDGLAMSVGQQLEEYLEEKWLALT